MSKERADDFCKEILELDGFPAWVIGKVEKGNRTAIISENAVVLDVPDEKITKHGELNAFAN